MGDDAIRCKSKEQIIIAKSTREVELIALASASDEANQLVIYYVKSLCRKKPTSFVLIHYDNIVAIGKVKNHYYNDKSRPIKRKYNTVRFYLSDGS